jgi:LacI family transcriptional regulator
MAVTIRDVAREAGVSRSTVSLVLQSSPQIPEGTRQRVRAAMQRLGYQPSRLAAGLRTSRSYILGLVITDLAFPHYALMALGIEDAVEQAGYSIIVANSHEDLERERRHVETLRRYRADGMFITPVQQAPEQSSAHLHALLAQGYPFLCLNREVPGLAADFCGSDAYAGMRELVAYLADDMGHRSIAILAGTQRTSTTILRLAGWRDELAARRLPAPDDLVVSHRGDRAGGEAAMAELLRRGAAFTAVVCVNDLVAVGALAALHRAGLRVPEDVSVAGMGGYPDVSPPDQALTTMADDYREIGRQAGQMLLRRVCGRSERAVERRVIPARLSVGATTAPPAPVSPASHPPHGRAV